MRERASFGPHFHGFWIVYPNKFWSYLPRSTKEMFVLVTCLLQPFPSFQSYAHLTGSSWSLVYFVSFYLISVLLLLNLVRYRFFFVFTSIMEALLVMIVFLLSLKFHWWMIIPSMLLPNICGSRSVCRSKLHIAFSFSDCGICAGGIFCWDGTGESWRIWRAG